MYIYIYCIHRATDPVSLQRHLYKDEAGEPDRLEASKERQSRRDAGIPRLRNQLATRYLPVCYGNLFIYSLFMISYLLNMVIFHSCVQLTEGTSGKTHRKWGRLDVVMWNHMMTKVKLGNLGNWEIPRFRKQHPVWWKNWIHKKIPFPALENH